MSTNVVYTKHYKTVEECPRCNDDMTEIRACHWRCKCGAEIDCSD